MNISNTSFYNRKIFIYGLARTIYSWNYCDDNYTILIYDDENLTYDEKIDVLEKIFLV